MILKTAFGDFNFGDLEQAAVDFDQSDIKIFRNFVSPETAARLRRRVFDEIGNITRRDFFMPMSDFTPRHMSVIKGHFLNAAADLSALYQFPDLLTAIDQIVYNEETYVKKNDGSLLPQGHVICYGDPIENMVATRLERSGDTHGFHVDDPALALVICLEAPPEGCGGDIEYAEKVVRGYRALTQCHLNAGDAYLMRTDYTKHRVTPLKGDYPRSILNLTYDYEGRDVTPNGSAQLLLQ